MNDYISRNTAITRLTKVEVTNELATMTDAKREIAEMPAADVAPVVHGKWVPPDGIPGFLVCSACEDCYVVAEWADEKKWMYCPACGAKMAKEEDND